MISTSVSIHLLRTPAILVALATLVIAADQPGIRAPLVPQNERQPAADFVATHEAIRIAPKRQEAAVRRPSETHSLIESKPGRVTPNRLNKSGSFFVRVVLMP